MQLDSKVRKRAEEIVGNRRAYFSKDIIYPKQPDLKKILADAKELKEEWEGMDGEFLSEHVYTRYITQEDGSYLVGLGFMVTNPSEIERVKKEAL